MEANLIDALKTRQETVAIGGQNFVITEIEFAVDAAALVNQQDGMLHLLVACVRDEAGAPVFKTDDIAGMKTMSYLRMQQLIQAALRVNGFSAEDNEKK
jgi:hypothetical protein